MKHKTAVPIASLLKHRARREMIVLNVAKQVQFGR